MTPPPLSRPTRVLASLSALLVVACVTRVTATPAFDEMAGMAPMLSVERFLQAVNARDLEAMRRLFGTYEGPITGDQQELELRMSVIAEILRHEDYRIVGERREPGREHPTTRVMVTITQGGRQIPDVPFLVVRTTSGGWLIEQVDLERITRG